MRSRKSDSMERQRKSCLYLFFFSPLKRSHLYVAQFLEWVLNFHQMSYNVYIQKIKDIFPSEFLWLGKERHHCVLSFVLFFSLIVFCIFDKCPNFNNLGFVISLIQLIRSSRFFLFLFSSSAAYLVFVIIFHWGWTGEGTRRENRAKITHVLFCGPSCLLISPSINPSTHLSIRSFIHPYMHTSIHPSTHISIHPFI